MLAREKSIQKPISEALVSTSFATIWSVLRSRARHPFNPAGLTPAKGPVNAMPAPDWRPGLRVPSPVPRAQAPPGAHPRAAAGGPEPGPDPAGPNPASAAPPAPRADASASPAARLQRAGPQLRRSGRGAPTGPAHRSDPAGSCPCPGAAAGSSWTRSSWPST